MKHCILLAILVPLLLTMACETTPEEVEARLLPENMSITLVQGSQTTKIIADFYYVPQTEQLDHITWSNHQTHYFEYDESNRIKVVRMIKVDTKVQEERWFVYDGQEVERIDLVKRNLDYIYLEPVDSIYAGYKELKYEGEYITEESDYEISADGFREEFVRKVSYTYDDRGNLISSIESDPVSGETRYQAMTYDEESKHPFYALKYYFDGESFVNNMLTKSDVDGFEYNYDLLLNDEKYPETVYEKLGSSYKRIINYSYRYL
jgi:hypothetical protein